MRRVGGGGETACDGGESGLMVEEGGQTAPERVEVNIIGEVLDSTGRRRQRTL